MRTLLFTLCFCLAAAVAHGQSIGGVWQGRMEMMGGCFSENNLEFNIEAFGRHLVGSSYHYRDKTNYIRKEATGVWDSARQRLRLQEGAVSEAFIPPHCIICIKYFDLTYSVEGNDEVLRGRWGGEVAGGMPCAPATVELRRRKVSYFGAENIPVVYVDTGRIQLDFYDNGQIDNDSITVLVNGQLVVAAQKLGLKPVTAWANVSLQNPVQEVTMRAENEGSIAPNTALLWVRVGEERHRVFLSAKENKTARIRIVYRRR